MTHRQKVDHLIEELGRQGVGTYAVAPPLFRLLWALGLEVPPPFFLGFRRLTLFWELPSASYGPSCLTLVWACGYGGKQEDQAWQASWGFLQGPCYWSRRRRSWRGRSSGPSWPRSSVGKQRGWGCPRRGRTTRRPNKEWAKGPGLLEEPRPFLPLLGRRLPEHLHPFFCRYGRGRLYVVRGRRIGRHGHDRPRGHLVFRRPQRSSGRRAPSKKESPNSCLGRRACT